MQNNERYPVREHEELLMDFYDQPTEEWHEDDTEKTQKLHPSQPKGGVAQGQAKMSRRRLFGLAGAGVAGAGALAVGGFALASELQRGTWNPFQAGPVASAAQVGHLLRRAGFGATPEELSMYASLGFSGAVEHLLNYQQ